MKRSPYFSSLLTLIIATFLLCSFTKISSAYAQTRSGLVSDTIDVLNYSINLDIIYLSNKDISGYTELTMVPRMNNVTSIPLDLLGMTVDSVLVGGNAVPGYTYNDTLLRIALAAPANIDDTLSVKVFYHGNPQMDPSGWGGFYYSSDSTYAYNLGVGFEAVPHNFGRVWFPCIDDFIDRATYDCYIRVKDTKMAVCGGTLMNETDNGDGTKTFYWRIHDEIPTYLASVAVGPYVPVSYTFHGMNGDIPVKIYVHPNDTDDAQGSFSHLLNILDVYENDFGPFLWERVGYVAVPFSSGAMEHATNIAYPMFCIDGSLGYESLYSHELSHHWFGDLVTCATAEDMWINEGWAEYCESIYREGLYGHSGYVTNVKSNHYYSLNNSHADDGGYYAIYGIPSDITYGSTVYNNGADVIHTLRYYLGDTLFFNTVKSWMDTYKFDHISTDEFSDFFSTQSGIDIHDFIDGWIKTPGFPQFAIDSMVYEGTGNDYTVYVRQKLHHKLSFVNSNKIEITFMDNAWEQYTDTIEFSGEYGSKLFHLPFAPAIAMMDLNEKVSDATTDYYQVIKAAGSYAFTNSFFTLNVQNISDSAFFRIEHNWVAADPLKTTSSEIFRVSDKRYWKIDGIMPGGFNATGRFNYNRNSSGFENTLLPTAASLDSLVLLYRANTVDDWQVANFTKSGSSAGFLLTENLQKGEYTFGVGKPNQSGISHIDNKNSSALEVYPNPSSDSFNINFQADEKSFIKIYDASNKLVYFKETKQKQGKITWAPSKLKTGVYYIYLYSDDKVIATKKAVYSK
jgi:hypothetical protein